MIAFPSGALADLVEHGRTGFLVGSAREMAEAIDQVATIDPEACRDAARARFSQASSTATYLAAYLRLLSA